MADFNHMSAAFQQGGQNNVQYVDQLGVLCQQKFKEFLTQYSDLSYSEDATFEDTTEETQTESVYAAQVQMMKEQEHTTLYVDFNHVLIYDAELARGVQRNFHRFEPYLRKAIQNYVREIDADYVIGEQGEKEFFVGLYNIGLKHKIRDLRTEKIGQLVSITGTVTRSTEVRPVRCVCVCLSYHIISSYPFSFHNRSFCTVRFDVMSVELMWSTYLNSMFTLHLVHVVTMFVTIVVTGRWTQIVRNLPIFKS